MPEQRVPVAEMVWAPPITQCLIALEVWPLLTPVQRELLGSCRTEVDLSATYPDRYAVRLDGITDAPPRTLTSLREKGVVDERGQLTETGVYTALWGPEPRKEKTA